MAGTFQCTLITPQAKVLDEGVEYASIPAWDGLMGFERLRAPIVVKLGDGPLRLDLPGGRSQWYFLAGGFAQMKDNQLDLLTESALQPDQIDREKVEQRLRDAEQREPENEQQRLRKQRDIRQAKAILQFVDSH